MGEVFSNEGFIAKSVAARSLGLSAEDRCYVRDRRNLPRPTPWRAIAQELKCSEDLLRRECDPSYVSVTPTQHELGDRAPALASGRTARGGTPWAEPPPVAKGPEIPSLVTPAAPKPPRPEPKGPATASRPPAPPRALPADGLLERGPRLKQDVKPMLHTAPPVVPSSPPPEAHAGGLNGSGPPAPPLSADLIARAVVAAARTYGDDPVRALTSSFKGHRRSVSAACLGIVEGGAGDLHQVVALLGAQHAAVKQAARGATPMFKSAVRAAARAVQYAAWRPEAKA